MAFFPTFLKERFRLQKQAETRAPFLELPTYREILDMYKENNVEFIPQFFWDSSNPDDEIAMEAMYKQCTSRVLRNTQTWICKHILFIVNIDNYLSAGVYTRIGTSMFNKLEQEGIISRELNIYYHDNFVRNLGDLLSEMSIEELPF